jgi:hypothetical protein
MIFPALLQTLLALHTTIKQMVQVVWLALKGMETAIIHQVRNRNKTVLIPRPPIVSMLVTALMLGMETNDLARNFHHRRAGAVVWAEDAAVRKRCPHG